MRDYYAVKSPVFPFNKFRGVDTILGPEMRSTGEVMGVAQELRRRPSPRRSSPRASGCRATGTIFLSVNDHDKRHVAAAGAGTARRSGFS